MIPFLFIISFILHLITLFTIIILYQKVKLLDNEDPKQIELMFQQYLDEIKEENNRLQQQLQQFKQNEQINDPPRKYVMEDNKSEYRPLFETEEDGRDEVETSLTANILSLADKGYSPNEIAQKLKCGKTEAELIIKFYSKKNS